MFSTSLRGASVLAFSLLAELTTAQRMLRSTSLSPCMKNSGFEASMFNVTFTPDDKNLRFQMKAQSAVSGMLNANITIFAYGFAVAEFPLNPCEQPGMEGMCPMVAGPFDLQPSNAAIDSDMLDEIPGELCVGRGYDRVLTWG